LLCAIGSPASGADVEVFQVYSWSTLATPHPDTAGDCSALDRRRGEPGWAVARREVADVSELELPEKQEPGTAFRIFVDYCVRVDGSRERPVGAMRFRAARLEDPGNVLTWGTRHYKATARVKRKVPKPGREHFDPPNFERSR